MSESFNTQTRSRQPILLMLFEFSFLSYLLRMNISVAQHNMLPELGLNDIQIGAIFSVFMLGYAAFQVPAGVLGDRLGPRRVLAWAAIGWGSLTFLTGFIPGRLARGAFAAFAVLLTLRFLLGAIEAATYPVAARAVAIWIPQHKHAFSNAVVIAGATVGSAFTGPLMAYVMQVLGWRATFYLSGVLPFLLAMLWWARAPETTRYQFTARQELNETAHAQSNLSWWSQLPKRNVGFLCMSYFLYSYVMFIFVFWLFKYLTDVRRLTVIGSGWATSLPFIAASAALPSLGYLSDRLVARMGTLRARRTVAMSCLVGAGILLLVGAAASIVWAALFAISLSVALLFSTEGCYWSTIIGLSGPNAGAAGGLMNMAGNLGGVVSTIAVPLLVRILGWYRMFALASLLAIVGALFWLMVRSSTPSGLALERLIAETSDTVGLKVPNQEIS